MKIQETQEQTHQKKNKNLQKQQEEVGEIALLKEERAKLKLCQILMLKAKK